jgi:hypothetical protein
MGTTSNTVAAAADASTLQSEVQKQLLAALTAPLITYLQGVKATPTIETIEAGIPAIVANELATSPALQGEFIVDAANILLAHLTAPTTPTPAAVTTALAPSPVSA